METCRDQKEFYNSLPAMSTEFAGKITNTYREENRCIQPV